MNARAAAVAMLVSAAAAPAAVKLIIDTDMSTDCDVSSPRRSTQ